MEILLQNIDRKIAKKDQNLEVLTIFINTSFIQDLCLAPLSKILARQRNLTSLNFFIRSITNQAAINDLLDALTVDTLSGLNSICIGLHSM